MANRRLETHHYQQRFVSTVTQSFADVLLPEVLLPDALVPDAEGISSGHSDALASRSALSMSWADRGASTNKSGSLAPAKSTMAMS